MASQTHMITKAEHDAIAARIKQAEKRTSGEVFAVVAHSSDDYFFVANFFAALWALVFGVVASLISVFMKIDLPLLWLVVLQLATFFGFALAFQLFPHMRHWFVPRKIAYRRASSNAVRQFMAHGIHDTQGRCGILLFVSIAEHYAEVIADAGISKKVDQAAWNDIVAELTSHAADDELATGFLIAIDKSADLLAEHFPAKAGKRNQLEDKVVEI